MARKKIDALTEMQKLRTKFIKEFMRESGAKMLEMSAAHSAMNEATKYYLANFLKPIADQA